MYLNYAREHWTKPGENPPVGVILATSKGAAEAHYALERSDEYESNGSVRRSGSIGTR